MPKPVMNHTALILMFTVEDGDKNREYFLLKVLVGIFDVGPQNHDVIRVKTILFCGSDSDG